MVTAFLKNQGQQIPYSVQLARDSAQTAILSVCCRTKPLRRFALPPVAFSGTFL
jgi:hypothetical protein